jgi:putative flippase GtrA
MFLRFSFVGLVSFALNILIVKFLYDDMNINLKFSLFISYLTVVFFNFTFNRFFSFNYLSNFTLREIILYFFQLAINYVFTYILINIFELYKFKTITSMTICSIFLLFFNFFYMKNIIFKKSI